MKIIEFISIAAIPAFVIYILSKGLMQEVKVYDCFMEGAKEGFKTAFSISPALLGLITAVSLFKASGALDLIVHGLKPLCNIFNIPSEIMPLAIMRPVSNGAAVALINDIFKNYHPDSFIGKTASVLMGSTETTFYTIAVYFGAVGIKKTRHTLAGALAADFSGLIASVIICNYIF